MSPTLRRSEDLEKEVKGKTEYFSGSVPRLLLSITSDSEAQRLRPAAGLPVAFRAWMTRFHARMEAVGILGTFTDMIKRQRGGNSPLRDGL
jgi:hypothetical protein